MDTSNDKRQIALEMTFIKEKSQERKLLIAAQNNALRSNYTGCNDKIVALEKTTWFHFRLMKTGFLFLLQTIY